MSKVFAAWLLQNAEQRAEFLSVTAQAAKREGADQDFQTIASLGFAADAGLLSDSEVEALKRGLDRLAGRSPVVSGVPMAFCADAVGILGIALGTGAVADAEVTGCIVVWALRFLKTSYDWDGADDWQRCLFAAADQKIGCPVRLPLPNSAAASDVRLALLSKGLIKGADANARQDAARTLEIAGQGLPTDMNCERAALRLAAIEWVIRAGTRQGDRTALEAAITDPQDTSRDEKRRDIDTGPRKKRGRPMKISDERKQRALNTQGGRARAQILYDTKYPTSQQVKNVPTILRHFLRTNRRPE